MRINLWYCQEMGFWRWTLVDNRRPVCRMESGQRQDLKLFKILKKLKMMHLLEEFKNELLY